MKLGGAAVIGVVTGMIELPVEREVSKTARDLTGKQEGNAGAMDLMELSCRDAVDEKTVYGELRASNRSENYSHNSCSSPRRIFLYVSLWLDPLAQLFMEEYIILQLRDLILDLFR